MYKLCKTEQSSKRQRELEKGLFEQMQHKKFDEILISDICTQLGITRKSFYRYFSGKEGALYSLIDHTLMDFYESGSLSGLKGGTPKEDLERFFQFWYDRRTLLGALYRSNLSGVLVERGTMLAQKEQLAPSVTKVWDTFYQEMAISFTICGLLSMIFKWYQDDFRISPKEMAHAATIMLTKPLLLASP